jgi:hypothetical protein
MACFYPEVYDLRPWLHDFTKLGLQTRFRTHHTGWLQQFLALVRRPIAENGHLPLRAMLHSASPVIPVNQQRIETCVLSYIQHCLLEMPRHTPLHCLDLFCTDGYFTCMLSNMRMGTLNTGLDPDAGNIRRAEVAARLLHLKQIRFVQADAGDFVHTSPAYDLMLCIGGLAHQPDPANFLQLLRKTGSQYLVLQSDVVLEPCIQDGHVDTSRAATYQHSDFTHAELGRWLIRAGWQILESIAHGPDNHNSTHDVNSSYYRCKAAG